MVANDLKWLDIIGHGRPYLELEIVGHDHDKRSTELFHRFYNILVGFARLRFTDFLTARKRRP
jgi:hypothetical protein